MSKTLEEIQDLVKDTIREIEYPPLNPTLTKEDLIDVLKEVSDFLFGDFAKKEYDDEGLEEIESLATDISFKVDEIQTLIERLKKQ